MNLKPKAYLLGLISSNTLALDYPISLSFYYLVMLKRIPLLDDRISKVALYPSGFLKLFPGGLIVYGTKLRLLSVNTA